MRKLVLLLPLLFCSPALASLDQAEIKGLGWVGGPKEAALTYEIYCGEGESKEVCDVVFLDDAIQVGEDLIPHSQIVHFWRNHEVYGSGYVKEHVYIRFLDASGVKRIVKFILINKRDAAEFWNLLNVITNP